MDVGAADDVAGSAEVDGVVGARPGTTGAGGAVAGVYGEVVDGVTPVEGAAKPGMKAARESSSTSKCAGLMRSILTSCLLPRTSRVTVFKPLSMTL